MGIRPKLILIFLVLGFAPLVVLSVVLYKSGLRSIENDLRNGVVRDTNGMVRELDATLSENETALIGLASSSALREYVNTLVPTASQVKRPVKATRPETGGEGSNRKVPAEVQESIRTFLVSKANRYTSIYCLSTSGAALFRANSLGVHPDNNKLGALVEFLTENYMPIKADPRVWNTPALNPLHSPIFKEANVALVRYSVPVFVSIPGAQAPRGVLIAELNSDTLFNDAMIGRLDSDREADTNSEFTSSQHDIIVINHERRVLYHTNEAFRYQTIDTVIPTFTQIASVMIAGESGWNYYNAGSTKWLVAYRPVNSLGVSVAVAGNYTSATRLLTRLEWSFVVLASIFGLATVVVFTHVLRNTSRSIERVTEGAVAIAGGRLDERIEVRSNDETRLLAESFNIMTDRLREQIARETETRQFESFMRISAMLTHDLKNAIAGLSLLVGNMERQFHREEFRADAMSSLTEATDKLRRLVAKLSEPVESLSSEHQLPRRIDLVPFIKRALDTTVEPVRALHQIEILLPKNLMATVEADRLEKVFENLIINAIEAMGAKSGKLTIEAGSIENDVFFSVSDTGPGMSEEFQRAKLFHPFATTKKSGIGLGLYTCREIVTAHGGRVEVESKRGSGATFRVVIPSEHTIMRRA